MYIVIIGCGRVGAELATSLAEEGNDVVVIDKDSKAFDRLGPVFNGITIVGTGIDTDILERAEINRANALAAVTNDDNVNLMVSQVAKEIFGVSNVVARVNKPNQKILFHEFGIVTFCPTDLGIIAAKSMLLIKGIQVRFTLGAGEVVIAELVIDKNYGKISLNDLEIPGKIRVSSVIREGKAVIPESNFVSQPGDILIMSVRRDVFHNFQELLEASRIRNSKEDIERT
ncbi:MAG: potassium channel family protein [bacterium]